MSGLKIERIVSCGKLWFPISLKNKHLKMGKIGVEKDSNLEFLKLYKILNLVISFFSKQLIDWYL